MSKKIITDYTIKLLSLKEIAAKYNLPYSTVRQYIIDSGAKLRDRKSGKQISMEKRGEEIKNKISDAQAKRWKNMSDDKLEKIKKTSKKIWESLDEDKKKFILSKRDKGLLKASRDGSLPERVIAEYLQDKGIEVVRHKKMLTDEKLECDMYLPGKGTIIEVNGPSHYQPIFGEEKLQAQKVADSKKFGLISRLGYVTIMVRVENEKTERQLRHVAEKVYQAVLNGKSVEVA